VRKSYAKRLKDGPVFRVVVRTFGDDGETEHFMQGRGKGIGKDWTPIGIIRKRKHVNMLMKAITLASRKKP
jgi:hypothetical protein